MKTDSMAQVNNLVSFAEAVLQLAKERGLSARRSYKRRRKGRGRKARATTKGNSHDVPKTTTKTKPRVRNRKKNPLSDVQPDA